MKSSPVSLDVIPYTIEEVYMIKDILEANDGVRPFAKQIEGLKALFPGCFHKDGSLDFGELKRQLEGKVSIQNEGYGLNFLGKSYARLLASLDTTTVITPDKEHNDKEENRNSDNLYISGDNIDALKHLLKSYEGQIKCIYIDPPYNTGSDGFVYNDKFNFTATDLMEKLSIDEEEAVKILDLTKRKSASHSAWLLFMYPRLQLARDLLTEDGVIFISIDDNEQADLKLLCDDVFGEENCLATFPRVTKKGGKSSDIFALNHDYILVYSRANVPKFYPLKYDDVAFKFKDEYFNERGYYKLNQTLDYDSLQYSPSLDYPIELDGNIFYPGSSEQLYLERKNGIHDEADWAWRWSKEKFAFGLQNGFIVLKKKKDGSARIYTKTYQKANISDDGKGNYFIEYGDRTKNLSTLEFIKNDYSNDVAAKDLEKSIGKKTFDYSKPIQLIKVILQISTGANDYILDFFSGSATTAEAVLQLNFQEHTNRKYILVQLAELCKENSSAYKNGYRTICDIGMDRVQKVSQSIKKEHPNTQTDLGFRHYTLQEPNQEAINEMFDFNPMSSNDLFAATDLYKQFGKDTILTTWLVRDGYHFAKESEVETLDLGGYTGYYMGHHLYLIDPGCDEAAVQAIFDRYAEDVTFRPTHVVVFGYNFTWTELENLQNNLRHFKDVEDNLRISVDVRY